MGKSAKRKTAKKRRDADAAGSGTSLADAVPVVAADAPLPDVAGGTDTSQKTVKPEKTAKAEKPGKPEKSEKPGKPTKAARPKPARKRGVKARPFRRQIAALPYRVRPDGRREVLILTSRETKRFVIPKGWPMKKKKKVEAAAVEAYEEAGVRGTVGRKPIGRYTYWKRLKDSFALIRVVVYPLEVREDLGDWPEREQRQYSWMAPADAAILVDEPGLARIIREFG